MSSHEVSPLRSAATVANLAALTGLANLRRSRTRSRQTGSNLVEVEALALAHEDKRKTTLTARPIDRRDGDAELDGQIMLAEKGPRRLGC